MNMVIILFGAPGVGKGTIAAMLHEKYHIPHISSGNMIRDLIKHGKAGLDLKAIIEKGELIPDLLVYKIVGDRIKEEDCKKGYILDGFPRTTAQAKFLDELLKHVKMKIDMVVKLTASEGTIIKRVSGRRICEKCDAIYHLDNIPPKKPGICDKCGGKLIQREDDTPEVVKRRIEVYQKQTAEVIDFYRNKGLLVDIHTEQPINDIFNEICELSSKQKVYS